MDQTVRIADWSNPRHVRHDEERILVEVLWKGCDCSTCRSRLRCVEQKLDSKGLMVDFQTLPSPRGLESIYVALDAPENGVDIKEHIAQTLDLRVQ